MKCRVVRVFCHCRFSFCVFTIVLLYFVVMYLDMLIRKTYGIVFCVVFIGNDGLVILDSAVAYAGERL